MSVGVDTMASILLAAKLNAFVSSSVPYFLRKAEVFLLSFKLTRDQKDCKEHKHLISIFVLFLLNKKIVASLSKVLLFSVFFADMSVWISKKLCFLIKQQESKPLKIRSSGTGTVETIPLPKKFWLWFQATKIVNLKEIYSSE